jgi:indolepyruvate ferredoxin oxidoreductase beta subunit
MEANIILAGVGGQGILSLAYVLSQTALERGLNVKQSEVHGMAQRGGAVQSHLRISRQPIESDLIPKGLCDLIIGVEPLESVRYLDFLSPHGAVVTSMNPFKNIQDYPPMAQVWEDLERVKALVAVDAESLARQAGSSLAQNTVLLGASSVYLDVPESSLSACVANVWKAKGQKVVDTNVKAFAYGRKMALFLRQAADTKVPRDGLRMLAEKLPIDRIDSHSPAEWVALLRENPKERWEAAISSFLNTDRRAASL